MRGAREVSARPLRRWPAQRATARQTASHAVLALTHGDHLAVASDLAGTETLRSSIGPPQGPDGGIPGSPGGDENAEVEGKALSAITIIDGGALFADGFGSGDTDLRSSSVP